MHNTRSLSATVLFLVAALALAAAMTLGFGTAASDAQGQTTTCPAGSVPSADGTACVAAPTPGTANENVVTTNSCVQGVLSDDGKTCLVPRLDAAPAPAAGAAPATTAPLAAPIPSFTG